MAKCAVYELIRQEADLPARKERFCMWLLHQAIHRRGHCTELRALLGDRKVAS